MKSRVQVVSPPAKPLMIFDGDCRFCSLWIRRWEHVTGNAIDYRPFQDAEIAALFPEIPREAFQTAVQLIETDGSVYSGAAAVFRALARNPQHEWLLDWHEHSPAFARVTEAAYHFVARHRASFSLLTRLLWGSHVETPSHIFVRWAFLRGLGIIYLIAFASLWVQITGLAGREGILPASTLMKSAADEFNAANIGVGRYHLMPTLCWLGAGDAFLNWQCAAGTVLAVLLLFGIAPAPCLFLLWAIYLSLCTVAGEFLGFQWDNLLLETGLLAMFLAPPQWLPRRPSRERPPSRLALWLLRWLLFRLMFESGCVKLLSGDPSWRHLTALTFHYETQPLPTWIGWYAHQMPLWVQKSDTAAMFAIELILPFLIFLPRRPRHLACLAFIALQVFILLTGNYGFFNLLTIVLSLTLLDDAALRRCWPRRTRDRPEPGPPESVSGWSWPAPALVPLVAVVALTSLIQVASLFRAPVPWPRPVVAAFRWIAPFRSFNSYGLIAVMTTSRPEIVVEGSNDGVNWQAYGFKYKPGPPNRRPSFVAPFQPRLDWQMWFAALGDYRQNTWFVNFCIRLLQGSPRVLALLEHNPFPENPPRYVRALVYEYRFTDPATRRRTGDWWRREAKGVYLPPISLRDNP